MSSVREFEGSRSILWMGEILHHFETMLETVDSESNPFVGFLHGSFVRAGSSVFTPVPRGAARSRMRMTTKQQAPDAVLGMSTTYRLSPEVPLPVSFCGRLPFHATQVMRHRAAMPPQIRNHPQTRNQTRHRTDSIVFAAFALFAGTANAEC